MPSSGLIINGSADQVAPPKDAVTLVNKLHEQKGITITHDVVEGADHFFKDEETMMNPMIDTVFDLCAAVDQTDTVKRDNAINSKIFCDGWRAM